MQLIEAAAGDRETARSAQPDPTSARTRALGDAGEILDAPARANYKRRLAELKEELEEAQALNDIGRVEKARQETDILTRALAAALGLGGRERRAGSHVERARVSVTRAVTIALQKITEHDGDLGRHFAATIRTGTFCSYTPDPRVCVAWVL